MPRPGSQVALRISLIYITISVLWIITSDAIAANLFHDARTLSLVQTYKGWAFVTATTVLLYALLRRAAARTREAYLQVVENSPNPIFAVNRDGLVTDWNAACETILAPRSSALGQPYTRFLLSEEDRTLTRLLFKRVLAGESLNAVVLHYQGKDGQPCHMISRLYPLTDSRGWVEACVFANTNISGRVAMEDALVRTARRLQALREVDQAILMVQSPQEIAVAALDHISALIPCHRASVLLFDPVDQSGAILATYAIGQSRLGTGVHLSTDDVRLTIQRVSENTVWVVSDLQLSETFMLGNVLYNEGVRAFMSVPLFARQALIGTLNVGWTEPGIPPQEYQQIGLEIAEVLALALDHANLQAEVRRHAEELEARVLARTMELADANDRLLELDRLKSKFVSDVSHELRTPVSNLSMYLHLLEHGKDSSHNSEYLQVLKDETGRLKRLIESILDISRLEASKNKITLAPVDLNRVVSQVVLAHLPRAQAAHVQVRFAPQDGLPPIWGEHNQLAQVVTNLLANAINYTPPDRDGQPGAIDLTTALDSAGQAALLTVQDNGLGIPAEDLPHLFERFYRGKNASQLDVPGTGLGLGIVKEIVTLHSGSIDVQSAVGVGSRFTVRLPLAERRGDPPPNKASIAR